MEDPDFYLYCDNEDIEDIVMEEVVQDWQETPQELRNDRLDCIDNLNYGDHTYVAGHHVTCTRTQSVSSGAQLTVTVH
jgi:hypothetical protein